MKGYAPPVASQAAGTLAGLQILAKSHPEILSDPAIRAAMDDPAQLQTALQAWQHRHGMDPNGVYDDAGTLQNSSWFSDNLPWITAAMGGALVAPAAIGALGAGSGTSAGSALAGVGPSTTANIAATTAAEGAPGGIAASVAGGAGMSIPWSTVNAGVNLFGNLFGAHEQASSAKDAAALVAAAQAKALAFEQAQAENAYQNNEVARKGNYDLYAAQQGRVGTVGEMFGLPSRPIPSYAPGVDPQFTGTSTPTAGQALTGATSGSGTGLDPMKGNLGSQISAYFKSRGVSDQETPYWVQKWPELVARGQQLNDPTYAMKRLAAADIFGGGSPAAPTSAGASLAPSSYQSIPVSPGNYLMGAH